MMHAVRPDPESEKYRVLKGIFGFDGFRPGQEAVVDAILSGRNALAVMPTGSGKSLCFQLPALVRGGLTVVVSPLVALMQDQVAALKLAGVRAETINSAKDRAENVDIWRRVAAGEVDLLYLSPERLMTDRMLAAIGKLPLSFLVVDEAHCISQWGASFRPEYDDLARLRDVFPNVPIAAFTATADQVTRLDIAEKLFRSDAEMFVHGFDRPNIRLDVTLRSDWKRQVLDFLGMHEGESGVIYCLSRKKTEETAAFLRDKGFNALPYHAGLAKEERDRNQDVFMSESAVIMVATIAFGMGIDKPDVRFVLHTDMPGSVEAYYQEFGRAGRDGAPARALMLYGLDDIRMRRMFIDQEHEDGDRRRREHKRLDALIAYCEAAECRRQSLLRYFGEESEPCGNCDACLEPMDLVDGTEEAVLALKTIQATGERFGTVHIVDVLRGGNTERIRKFGHESVETYGAGTAHNAKDWQSLIRQLVANGFLTLDIQGFGGLSVSDKGHALLRGELPFRYRRDSLRRERQEKTARSTSVPTETMSGPELKLFKALKQLRSEIAREGNVPAYVVFTDRSLADMAAKRPTCKDSFSGIHGVGAAKLEKFAAPFIDLILRETA
ncbi:DNA helicase RecQ [Nisaea denitrificans]|uniref:DNA helicase RecQ n=1 Tax=Nisaea denitrificans TaxID=390877 RepID=UPI000421A3AC|nr:DNA helicase RecQ [Nisaea denitrificans]